MYQRRAFTKHLIIAAGALLTCPLRSWAQSGVEATETHSKVGVVIAVGGDKIYVNSGSGPLTVKPKRSTRIWKGAYGVKIDAIRPGDDLATRGVFSLDGTFVPSEIWTNITILDGMVKSVSNDWIEVDLIRNDSVSESKIIKLSANTVSSQNVLLNKSLLQAGRAVQVIGLPLEDGAILATRVRIYENGRLVDSPNFRIHTQTK